MKFSNLPPPYCNQPSCLLTGQHIDLQTHLRPHAFQELSFVHGFAHGSGRDAADMGFAGFVGFQDFLKLFEGFESKEVGVVREGKRGWC
ncbi:hypothetical protein ACFX13_010447 [Malus domestica]